MIASSTVTWRLRLSVLVLAATLPFVIFVLYSLEQARDRRLSEAVERGAQLAALGAYAFEDTLAEVQSTLDMLAQVPEVVSGSPQACARKLAPVQDHRPWAGGIWVVEKSGIVRCTTLPNGLGHDLSGRQDFREAIARGSFGVSDVVYSSLRRLPTAVAARAVETSDGQQRLLAVTLNLTWFQTLSAVIGERTASRVFLLDAQSHIVARFPDHAAGPAGDKARLAAAVASGQSSLELDDGSTALIAHAPVVGTGYRLAVLSDQAAVVHKLTKAQHVALGLFFLVVAIAAVAVWVTGERLFAHPLRELDQILRITLERLPQGVAVITKNGRVPFCNRRARDFLELPDALIERQPTSEEILAYQAARGEFVRVPEDVKPHCMPVAGTATRYERERPNGTVLEIETVPLDAGGCVRTYSDVTARKLRERALHEEATSDPLTGVANRRRFDSALGAAVRAREKSGEPLSVVLIDIDHFKCFNDRFGHVAGDACLKAVAETLSRSVRRERDLIARFGGEEFIVLMPNTDRKGAETVAERMRLSVEVAVLGGAPVTLSAGVAVWRSGEPLTTFLERADRALYLSKRSGRNQVSCADEQAA